MIAQVAFEFAYLGWGLASLLLLVFLPIGCSLLWQRRFPESPQLSEWPRVAVVVPSRNEGAQIRRAFQSLLDLSYPNLRIIALNDRSNDDTGGILDELAQPDPRVEVIHIEQLPEGWLGKNHANHVGAERALQEGAEWLLFTDGDILFAPHTLQAAIAAVVQERRDHLTLWPRMEPGSWAEQALLTTFALFFQLRFGVLWVRTRIKMFYAGIGAFNLISSAAYRTLGGHRPLAMEVVDDVKLGKLVKQHSFRSDARDGRALLSVRWQQGGVRGVIGGLMKNTFASQGFSVVRVLFDTLLFATFFLLPPLLFVLYPSAAGYGFGAAAGIALFTYALTAWRTQVSLTTVLLFPFLCWLFPYIMWKSMILTLRQGGVRWRDTFYPLEILRRGRV